MSLWCFCKVVVVVFVSLIMYFYKEPITRLLINLCIFAGPTRFDNGIRNYFTRFSLYAWRRINKSYKARWSQQPVLAYLRGIHKLVCRQIYVFWVIAPKLSQAPSTYREAFGSWVPSYIQSWGKQSTIYKFSYVVSVFDCTLLFLL